MSTVRFVIESDSTPQILVGLNNGDSATNYDDVDYALHTSAGGLYVRGPRPDYHPIVGPNSNTFLNNIFSACGISLDLNTFGPPLLGVPYWRGTR